MRLRHRPVILVASILVSIGVAAHAQTMKAVPDDKFDGLEKLPSCVPSAPAGYPARQCLVTIDREAPVTPPALLVSPGTHVFVRVTNTRPNEAVLFAVGTTRVPPPDVAGAAIKNLITPLQSLLFTQRTYQALDGGVPHPGDKIHEDQVAVMDRLSKVQESVVHATAAFTCLSSYEAFHDDFTCSQAALLTRNDFNAALEHAIAMAQDAAGRPLPLQKIEEIKGRIEADTKDCLQNASKAADPASEIKKCQAAADRHLSNQARLNSAVADIQKAQSSLLVIVQTLRNFNLTQPVVAFEFVPSKLNNMVITVSGQEAVNKTASPIATVTINTQNTNWVISTGILFSNLKYHTFSNAPIIVNGQPVLDPSGKVTTIVTRADTSPSVVAPELLVSYRLPWISRFSWENKCRGGCSFLLSGGAGANLTSKSADFDSGFSFQIGSVLLTPTVHFGRENRLSNGVAVGQKLGSSPPSPLPTDYQWVKKFGIAITYALPIP